MWCWLWDNLVKRTCPAKITLWASPADHPHRPGSHQQSRCILSNFQKLNRATQNGLTILIRKERRALNFLRACVLRGLLIFSDKIFKQVEWQGWPFGISRDDNNFADVTLAWEDGQQVESHKVIFAGQVLFTKSSHSTNQQHWYHDHWSLININSIEQRTRGCSCRWADTQLPTFPQLRYGSINYPWALMV